MKRVRRWLVRSCLMVLFICCSGQSVIASDEVHLPKRWQGMPTTGKAAMLTVRVEFQDVKFQDGIYTEEQLLAMIDGTECENVFPDMTFGKYDSLQGYYKRSSYGKLEISTGGDSATKKVYSYTLSKNRLDYASENGGNELVKEVLSGLNDKIDYSDYDLDNDGYIDGICINFAGMNEGRDSIWWSHVAWYQGLSKGQDEIENQESDLWDGVKAANYMLFHTQIDAESGTVNITDNEGHRTLIHETGHMLGLDDYYNFEDSSKGIQTEDMMCYNEGEHNGFSKWLLGWIDEEQIQWVTKDSIEENGEKISLVPISTEQPKATDKLIAVITPSKENDTDAIYSEYFVVEYDKYGVGNYKGKTGFRVFHVDAHLDETEYDFVNHNTNWSGNRLIYAVSTSVDEMGMRDEYFTSGDSFAPDTVESTAFYGGNIKGFTGISLTDFKDADDENAASVYVTFEEQETMDGTLKFTADREKIGNMGRVVLTCDKPLFDNYSFTEQAYYMDAAGEKHPVSVNISYTDSHQLEVMYTNYQEKPLKPNTEYTLVLPADKYQIDEDLYSKECKIVLKTDTFAEIKESYTYAYEMDDVAYSNLFLINKNKSGKLRLKENEEGWRVLLYTYSDSVKEKTTASWILKYPEGVEDPSSIYVDSVEGWKCQDGSIVVAVKVYQSGSQLVYVYKVDENGEQDSSEPYVIKDSVTLYPQGNGVKAIANTSRQNDELSVYEIDFKSSPQIVPEKGKIYFPAEEIKICFLDQSTYAIINPSVRVEVYDSDDRLRYTLSNDEFGLNNVYTAAKTKDGIALIHFLWDEEAAAASIGVSLFDENGTFIETKKLLIDVNGVYSWNMTTTNFGYHLIASNQDGSVVHYFLDEKFAVLSNMETSSVDGAVMNDQFVFCGNTINGLVVSVTDSILEKEEEGPNSGEGNDSKNEPETGGGSGTGNGSEAGGGSGSENESEAGGGSGSGNNNGKQDIKKETAQKKPATGDENSLLLWLGITITSVALMNLFRKKKYMKEKYMK